MSDKVKPKKVTVDNWEAMVELELVEASIYRFMIDRKHQGKGYSRAALSKALEEIRAIRG
jgi:GNAT superfamily N-acetyltransferase